MIYFGAHTKSMNTNRAVEKFTPLIVLAAFFSAALQMRAQANANWVASWGASQQIPEPQNSLPAADLTDVTLRQIFHLSIGGPMVRVHVSNAFGTEALHFTLVHIARPLSPRSPVIDPASDKQ